MYVCMYMYVCTYMCMYVCMCVCMFVCICIYVRVCYVRKRRLKGQSEIVKAKMSEHTSEKPRRQYSALIKSTCERGRVFASEIETVFMHKRKRAKAHKKHENGAQSHFNRKRAYICQGEDVAQRFA